MTEFEKVAREQALVEPMALGTELEMGRFGARERLVAEYAWAIPNEAALQAIAAEGPIVEIGAGNGYWAWELERRGVDIVAYDPDPYVEGQYVELGGHRLRRRDVEAAKATRIFRKEWAKVHKAHHSAVEKHHDRALFMCWPTYGGSWATEAVERYKGETVIHVGEFGGCTGDELLVPTLCLDFKMTDRIDIPRFYGLHDFLSVWRR